MNTNIPRIELQSGYSISRVIMGGWQLARGHGPVDENLALQDMRAFVREGITTFDCADIYTGEELIGKFIQEHKSAFVSGSLPPIQIHTKYVPDLDELPTLTKTYTEAIIDRSLKRLGVERLDMVQFHWWDYTVPGYIEVANHLLELKQAGKIRYISAPISDTTIASALSQNADVGGTVRTRLKYVLPAGAAALVFYALSAAFRGQPVQDNAPVLTGDPKGLPILLIPVVIIFLLLKGRHLLHGLLAGLMVGVVLALVFNLMPLSRVFSLDPENFTARSFIIDGISRAVGISFFTILLMGLISTIKASGLLKRLVDFSSQRGRTIKHAEAWISSTVGAAVLLTCHSIVAILTVGEFTKQTGEKINIHRYRRANLLSLVVCTFPFLLPYFIPVILMANTTSSGSSYNIPPVSSLQTGLHNFTSWALLAMVLLAVIAGFGRYSDARSEGGKTGGDRSM